MNTNAAQARWLQCPAMLGRHRNGKLSNVIGVATVAIMELAAIGMVVTFVIG